MSDRELIAGFLEGDSRACATIQEWITVVVRSRSWNQGSLADEIVSDTTFKLLTNLRDGQFRFESSLKTYVQRIARFTIIDASRRNRWTQPDGNEIVDSAPDPVDLSKEYEKKEQWAIYQRIVALIGLECRAMWKMIFYDELPYSQIAKTLNISVGAVKTRVLRCKEKAIEIRKKIT
jgi:RNA polymerase sigma factor (sigma-70 family)